MNANSKLLMLTFLSCLSSLTNAQSIQRVSEEYRDPEQIKLAAKAAERMKLSAQSTMPALPANSVADGGVKEVVLPPAALAIPPVTPLMIQPGQRLSQVLATWLKTQDIALTWEPAGSLPGRIRDIVVDSAWQASDTNLEKTLTDVLLPFGLEAHVLKTNLNTVGPTSVVVRNLTTTRP